MLGIYIKQTLQAATEHKKGEDTATQTGFIICWNKKIRRIDYSISKKKDIDYIDLKIVRRYLPQNQI